MLAPTSQEVRSMRRALIIGFVLVLGCGGHKKDPTSTSDELESALPDDHMLVIERAADRHFDYASLARKKATVGAPWRYVVVGTTTPSGKPRHGQGAVWVDLGELSGGSATGKVLALWSRTKARRSIS